MGDHSDIDHTGLTGVGGGGGGGLVGYDRELRTAGDLTVSTTSAGAAIPTLPNLIVPATSGDLIEVSIDLSLVADAESVRFDVASIVAAAVVNYISSETGTPSTTGITGWSRSVTTAERLTGVVPYVVQAGDISGGNLELSLRAWLASGTSRVVEASAGSPLRFWVKNFGQ